MLKLAVAVPLLFSFAALATVPQAPATSGPPMYRVIEVQWIDGEGSWQDSARTEPEGLTLRDLCARFDRRFVEERNNFGEPARPVSTAVLLDLVAAEGWELVLHDRWPAAYHVAEGWQQVAVWDEAWTWRRTTK